MKLRRRGQLLPQIRRGIDQEPVVAVGADGNRSLRALKFWVLGSRGLTHRTAAIPLRNATTCRGAQDDDAQHDPSPGISESEILGRLMFRKMVPEKASSENFKGGRGF